MDCTVCYDVWQMQCCGSSIAVGMQVKWLARKERARVVPAEIEGVEYRYEAHCGDWEQLVVLEGKITKVQQLYKTPLFTGEGEPAEKIDWLLANSGLATGYDPVINGLECVAYIVKLTDCTVRPAAEEDLISPEDEDLDYPDIDPAKCQTWDPYAEYRGGDIDDE